MTGLTDDLADAAARAGYEAVRTTYCLGPSVAPTVAYGALGDGARLHLRERVRHALSAHQTTDDLPDNLLFAAVVRAFTNSLAVRGLLPAAGQTPTGARCADPPPTPS